jgi:glycosyltransferase
VSKKFSLITVCFNSEEYISHALGSVQKQSYKNIEHIIIDGNSSDHTIELIHSLRIKNSRVVSEPDESLYDAMNKGLHLATGDIIGFLNSDDLLADDNIIEVIESVFASNPAVDIVYGDINIVTPTFRIARGWISGKFDRSSLPFGWMPGQPSFYFKRTLLENVGFFNLKYKIASDYDFMLRCLLQPNICVHYLRMVTTIMRLGGVSNSGVKNLFLKSYEDYLVASSYFKHPIVTVVFKILRKFPQIYKA